MSDSFKEIGLISSGGFSSVFKCEHKLTHKLYAIKKISFEDKNHEEVLKEINILSKIKSKFVVKYYNYWVENNYYLDSHNSNLQTNDLNRLFYEPLRTKLLHIQMELCSLTLREVINILTNDCKSSANTLSLFGYYISSELLYEILECVQYLHQQNPAIIHRDLKPDNILLTKLDKNKRFVKLTDFGLSTYHEFSDQSHTKNVGTNNYKATEINLGSKTYTTKADIYSLGSIIWKLFQLDHNVKLNESLLPLSEIKNMALKAMDVRPELRPDCNQMLSQHNKWRLNHELLSSNEEFIQIIGRIAQSNSIDENFIEYFIQNKCVFNNDCNKQFTSIHNDLSELCDQKLNINNDSSSSIDEDDYESNDKAANIDNEKFIAKVMSNNKNGCKYKCVFNAVCNKQFTRKQHCLDHINTHTGHMPYKCDHNSNCTFKTAHKKTLNHHIQSVHLSKKYACDWSGCGFQTSFDSSLIRHKRTHTGEKPYKCDWSGCDYKTSVPSKLIPHKRTHTGEKPFKCDWNGCAFRTAYDNTLTRHKRTHTGEKLFKCDWNGCDYRTKRQDGLTQHKRVHTGELPFKCHHRDCEYKTAYRSNLRTHLKKCSINKNAIQ